MNKLFRRLINPFFYFFSNLLCELSEFFSPLLNFNPVVLKVRITTKCNLSCGFCYLKDGLNQKEEEVLDLDEWRLILEKLPRTTIIDITGAEPTLAPNFIGFLKLLNEFKFKYSMTTNGTIKRGNIVEELVRNNLSVLMVSLDGLEETHNLMRGKPGSFKKTIEFVQAIDDEKKKQKKTTPLINIKTVILDENHSELVKLIDYCMGKFRLDIYSYTLLFQNKARGGMTTYTDINTPELKKGNTAVYSKKNDVINTVRKIFQKEKKLPFPIVFKPRLSKKNILKYILNPSSMNVGYCPQFKNTFTIYYNGLITPCDLALEITNVRELDYNISKIHNLNKFKKIKAVFSKNHPACQGCCVGKHT